MAVAKGAEAGTLITHKQVVLTHKWFVLKNAGGGGRRRKFPAKRNRSQIHFQASDGAVRLRESGGIRSPSKHAETLGWPSNGTERAHLRTDTQSQKGCL